MPDAERDTDRFDIDVTGGAAVQHRGRVDDRWILYPSYTLSILAGLIATNTAFELSGWKAGPVFAGWAVLVGWIWLYSIGYRYRRPIMTWFSFAAIMLLGPFLTFVALDRAPPQLVASGQETALRSMLSELVWVGGFTGGTVVLILLHALFLGRGRRSP
jgi:hypothetical protein